MRDTGFCRHLKSHQSLGTHCHACHPEALLLTNKVRGMKFQKNYGSLMKMLKTAKTTPYNGKNKAKP